MTHSRTAPVLAAGLLTVSLLAWCVAWYSRRDVEATASDAAAPQQTIPFEEWARAEFMRKHPGGKPLNWSIAQKAEDFVRAEPMGRFVLHSNDCSDFTDAILDEALGARARFRRASKHHVLAPEPSLWEFHRWEPGLTLMPGDEIAVRHSPHYPPYDEAPWHRGIVGTDGMVCDWTKLRSWSTDRYGRHTVEWFVHNSSGPNEVIVRRLRPAYRYLIEPIPVHGVPSSPVTATPRSAR